MMEDKREELNEKVKTVSVQLEEIRLCKEEITKISEAFDFMEKHWYCEILVRPGGEKESLEIPLTGPRRSRIVSAIKDELIEKVKDCKDEISKAYQELDKLLK
jgi:hypothetical protein|nr:MAG TPA: hypothetical protein [Caudoviricetes sp.]